MASKRKQRQDPAYIREQGKREANNKKERNITFCFSKHVIAEGETFEEWEKLGFLKLLIIRLKYLGQYPALTVRQKKWIKEYHKVDFPPNSKFTEPKHVQNVTWAVMHITPTSKEVVAGYIEDEVFYIIFLDKDHKFWPTKLKNT